MGYLIRLQNAREVTHAVPESAGNAKLSVRRLNGTDTGVSVDYATADGTASGGAVTRA